MIVPKEKVKLLSHSLTIITLFYCVLSVVLLYFYGVRVVNDSYRYFDYAEQLQNGFYMDPHNFWYLGYVLFIYVIKSLQGSIVSIVIAQYCIGYVAMLSLYHASLCLYKRRDIALVTAIYYMLFFELHTWNSYVLCESLYVSLICISLYCIVSIILSEKRRWWHYVGVALAVFITALTKPTGIALIGAVSVLIFSVFTNDLSSVKELFVIGAIASLLLVLANKMLATYQVINNYELGEIVYGITTLHERAEYRLLVVNPPDKIFTPDIELPPLLRILQFIFHHPVYWIKLFAGKLIFYLSHVRPYWSSAHNLFSLAYLLPIYFFFVKSFRRSTLPKHMGSFALAYVTLHIVSVCLTSIDWDGRFLLPIIPLLVLVGSYGLTSCFNRKPS